MLEKSPIKSFKRDQAISGSITVAGDKSISHRALIFSALAHGKSKITGLLEGEDVLKTAAALRKMGVTINQHKDHWEVNGSGVAGLIESDDILDMGNSGTAARLLAGLVTPYNFTSFFTGDASLRRRPMARVFEPIEKFGAKVLARQNNLMPFAIVGAKDSLPIEYKMKVASAQIKSAILLASLATKGVTTIFETEKCRDHTEIMMRYLGLNITTQDFTNDGKIGTKISYSGLQEFAAKDFVIPADISSAAFIMVAALLVKGSKVTLLNVGVNPLRDGIIETLIEMGGQIQLLNQREVGGEKVADILVEHSQLKGVIVPQDRVPKMIDEFPILAIAAANAQGITKMSGLAELKVKESNRFAMIVDNLQKCGVTIQANGDAMEIKGGFVEQKQLIQIPTAMDHRIAMSFYIMGMMMENGIEIDDSSMINTSFPNFFEVLNSSS